MSYTLYTGDRCQFCAMAKGLLNARGLIYVSVNIDKDPVAKDFILNKGHRSIPQLYLNDEHIADGYHGIECFLKELK